MLTTVVFNLKVYGIVVMVINYFCTKFLFHFKKGY